MLSTTLRQALRDTRHQLPPTFLLPWAASLSTASTSPSMLSDSTLAPPLPPQRSSKSTTKPERQYASTNGSSPRSDQQAASWSTTTHKVADPIPKLPSTTSTRSAISSSVRDLLPLMRAQAPHYITVHIQGNPYLVTEGDTIRLPYLMRDVEPGDILRLNRAINLGSRDYTLKAAASAPKLKSTTASSQSVLDPTTGTLASHSTVMPSDATAVKQSSVHAPHFIPHIAKGKYSYIDDRLFVCRALVMGVESEPLRIKEKTKRRQRHVRRVKSKHRYTIIKIKELRIRSLEELESGDV